MHQSIDTEDIWFILFSSRDVAAVHTLKVDAAALALESVQTPATAMATRDNARLACTRSPRA